MTAPCPLATRYFGTPLARFCIWIGVHAPRLNFIANGITIARTWWWIRGMTPIRRKMFFQQLEDECRAAIGDKEREEWEHEAWRQEVIADRAANGRSPL